MEFGEVETCIFMVILHVRIKKTYVRIRASNMGPILLI